MGATPVSYDCRWGEGDHESTRNRACEASVVLVAVCKAMQVAAGLALPRDVSIKMSKF